MGGKEKNEKQKQFRDIDGRPPPTSKPHKRKTQKKAVGKPTYLPTYLPATLLRWPSGISKSLSCFLSLLLLFFSFLSIFGPSSGGPGDCLVSFRFVSPPSPFPKPKTKNQCHAMPYHAMPCWGRISLPPSLKPSLAPHPTRAPEECFSTMKKSRGV